ncbi:alternative oxidase, partial [Tilletiaria anomala UBC 951]
ETIAGVPGLVAAACRHLQSLRVMRRDKGWIRTLLEDAENERMHLLTAMEYAKPGRLMRLAILGAQGVYFNAFFLSYLFFPRVSHRLVGILEEEAVSTYSNIIRDVEEGRLPEWEDLPAPAIAKEYWKMPDSAKMLDVLYAIRADEATHRFINHSLGSLDQRNDYNPFAVQMPPAQLRGTVSGLTPLQAK